MGVLHRCLVLWSPDADPTLCPLRLVCFVRAFLIYPFRLSCVCLMCFVSLSPPPQLRRGEEEASRRSSRLSKREDTMDKLKDAQRSKVAKDNALNVERKRCVCRPFFWWYSRHASTLYICTYIRIITYPSILSIYTREEVGMQKPRLCSLFGSCLCLCLCTHLPLLISVSHMCLCPLGGCWTPVPWTFPRTQTMDQHSKTSQVPQSHTQAKHIQSTPIYIHMHT